MSFMHFIALSMVLAALWTGNAGLLATGLGLLAQYPL